MKKTCCLSVLAILISNSVSPVRAMVINITYDASVTNLANPALVQPAVATAVQFFQNTYTNPITLNITVAFDVNVGLGQSEFNLLGIGYSQLTNALASRRTSTADFSAVASLPASDPIGAGTTWYVPRAEYKALGLLGVGANDAATDGTVTFSPPSSTAYTFNPNSRAVAGKFDFIGVVEHEISEVMGRVYLLGDIGGYAPYDLFRFTNNAARSFDVNANNAYLSVDNGATVQKFFYTDVNTGDIQDWASSTPPDAFDASVPPGKQLVISSADIISLDILGYNMPPVTQPVTTLVLTGVRLTNGTFRISFTNVFNAGFSVLATTNLTLVSSNWTVLGAPTESPSGQYQFTDSQAITNQQRFYRVRSP